MSDAATPDLVSGVWSWDGGVLKPSERLLLRDGVPVPLGARAFELLLALLHRRHRVATRDELIDAVWAGLVVEENNLSVQITTLRKVLGAAAIATVPGRGYQLTLSLRRDDEATATHTSTSATATPRAPPAAPAAAGNLPLPAVDLLGRDEELAALGESLATQRLTTMVGAGGIGKTLLALHAARQRLGRETDGVWWVDLSGVPAGSAADALARVVASAVGLALPPAAPAQVSLAGLFKPWSALVLLDNAEHVIDGVAELLATLLAAAPALRWLVTSQATLRLAAEHVHALGTLATPPADVSLPDALRYGALALLNARACAASNRFVLTAEALPAALQICQRLDGLPLALEMAAPRLAWLGAKALNERLGQSLKVLASAARGAPTRQQTLQATLVWSHGLLSPLEQRVLRRLGVFVGGFTLDDAQRVAAESGDDDPWTLIDALAALVDRSWVRTDGAETPRYRLLESARGFALEQLREFAEEAAARRRHAEAMARHGDQHASVQWNELSPVWAQRYPPEVDNFCAAFDWALERGEHQLAARTFLTLPFVLKGARTVEIVARAEALRPHLATLPPALAAEALAYLAMGVAPHRVATSVETAREALALCRQGDGSDQLQHYVLSTLSQYLTMNAEPTEAKVRADEARLLMQRAGAAPWPLWLQLQQHQADFMVAAFSAEPERGLAPMQGMLHVAQTVQSSESEILARTNCTALYNLMGRYQDTVASVHELLPLLQGPQRIATRVIALINLLGALIELADPVAARAVARDVLPLTRRVGYRQPVLANVTTLAVQSGEHTLAARVLGHLDAMLAARNEHLPERDLQARRVAAAALQEQLGAEALARLQAEGAALSAEQLDTLVDAGFAAAATQGPGLRVVGRDT